MKHILILVSLVFVGVAISNLVQDSVELSITALGLGIIGAVYLVIQMLRGKLRGSA